jgi:hypothetical protein
MDFPSGEGLKVPLTRILAGFSRNKQAACS